MKRLTQQFFTRPTCTVAQEMLGKILVFNSHDSTHYGIITETEAYVGQDDPACHAAKGRTTRTDIMFGSAGYSYVYLIYGMYHCLNIVTEEIDFPAAVLIRGLALICADSTDANTSAAPFTILDGPGKICRHFQITKAHNKIDTITSERLYMLDAKLSLPFTTTPRIGIKLGTDKLWRFVVSPHDIRSLSPDKLQNIHLPSKSSKNLL